MNRVFLSLSKSFSVVALATAAMVSVASANDAAAPAKADPLKGAALYKDGDAARNITACASCHGEAGASTSGMYPKLAAQHAGYVAKQLNDFTTPARNNAIMSGFAKAMTEKDMRDVAAYLSLQKSKAGAAKNKDTAELGKSIYRAGIAEKNVPACAGCHSPNGAGIPAQFPRLAGQHQDYTLVQLTAFGKGDRKNSVQMTTISKRMSEDEMKAVSDYIAGLK